MGVETQLGGGTSVGSDSSRALLKCVVGAAIGSIAGFLVWFALAHFSLDYGTVTARLSGALVALAAAGALGGNEHPKKNLIVSVFTVSGILAGSYAIYHYRIFGTAVRTEIVEGLSARFAANPLLAEEDLDGAIEMAQTLVESTTYLEFYQGPEGLILLMHVGFGLLMGRLVGQIPLQAKAV